MDDEIYNEENRFYNFSEASKIIGGIGRNNLFKLLREHEILDFKNHPIGEWEESDYFKVLDDYMSATLVSTQRINYIKKHLMK